MSDKSFVEVKIPSTIIEEIDKLVNIYQVKKEFGLNSREAFIKKALTKFIEEIKALLPNYQLSNILRAIGY
ncbi:MAG: hypothetical protein ACTSQY_01665 [Candidatus Odinarchaeia archaeon]